MNMVMHMVKVQTPVLYPVFAQGAHNAIEKITACTLFQPCWFQKTFFCSFFTWGFKKCYKAINQTNQQYGESKHYKLSFEAKKKVLEHDKKTKVQVLSSFNEGTKLQLSIAKDNRIKNE